MSNAHFDRTVKHLLIWAWIVFGVILISSPAPAQSREPVESVWLRTTNWVPRYLTNVIKVSIQTNSFHNEYHTNWIRQEVTNVVEVFRTNLVSVNSYRTNVQVAYLTNVVTLNVTNLETVLVTKTNQVAPPVAARPARPDPVGERSTIMEFELTHTGKPLKPDQFPIRVVLKSTEGTTDSLPVQEWRVERENGGVFLIASKADFTGDLPVGAYNVTARLRAADGKLRNVRGQLDIRTDGSPQRAAAFVSLVR